MKKILYSNTILFGLLTLTLMAGTFLNGSILAQPTPSPTTGNVTSGEISPMFSIGVGLSFDIFSKTTNTNYVYDNIKTPDELLKAIQEVEQLTHPELVSAAPEIMAADESDQQFANGIFEIASKAAMAEQNATDVTPEAIPPALLAAGAKLAWDHRDVIISTGKDVIDWIGDLF